MTLTQLIPHFTRMGLKAMWRFKLHTIISLLSLSIGFLCLIGSILISNYADSFDRGFANSDKIYNMMIRTVGDSPFPDRFPIVNDPLSRYLRAGFPEIPYVAKASSSMPLSVKIEDQSMIMDTKYVEDDFFRIFPLETLSGLETGEALPPNSALISESGAMKLYGRTDVVGERLEVENEYDLVVAGVTRTLDFPSHLEAGITFFNTEIYIPMALQDQSNREARIRAGSDPDADRWGNQNNFVYLRFADDMEVDEAEWNRRIVEWSQGVLPEDFRDIQTFNILPVNELVPTQMSFLTGGFNLNNILIFAGALVLLIGCLNYSNLVIAQLSLRSQEIGVEKILGAKRSLLLLQYCYESLMFIGIAVLLTLLVLVVLLGQVSMTGFGPALLLDPSLWLSLVPAIIAIVIIAGGYPALRTALVPLVTMLRPKGSSGYSGRLRALMVGIQFFISATLMILAVVMFIQNRAMTQQLDAGTSDVKVAFQVDTDNYDLDTELLINQLKTHPAVLSVTQMDDMPWNISNSSSGFSLTPEVDATTTQMSLHRVGYEYGETMGMPILMGRDFSRERSTDRIPPVADLTSASGPYSVVIDELAAASFGWTNPADAIGQSIYSHYGPPTTANEFTVELNIVGIIDERRYEFIDFTSFGSEGNLYLLRPDATWVVMVKLARSNLNAGLQHIDQTWSSLLPDIPLQREFIDDLFYASYTLFLSISVSIGALSVFGFLVASIGLLGNATFITNIRRKEVGIRKVMGASSKRLLSMLLLDFAKPILIANALAWPIGYFMGAAYTSFFSADVDITLMPFIVSFGLSALIAFAAVFSQSWKSSRVRPAMVLRYE